MIDDVPTCKKKTKIMPKIFWLSNQDFSKKTNHAFLKRETNKREYFGQNQYDSKFQVRFKIQLHRFEWWNKSDKFPMQHAYGRYAKNYDNKIVCNEVKFRIKMDVYRSLVANFRQKGRIYLNWRNSKPEESDHPILQNPFALATFS